MPWYLCTKDEDERRCDERGRGGERDKGEGREGKINGINGAKSKKRARLTFMPGKSASERVRGGKFAVLTLTRAWVKCDIIQSKASIHGFSFEVNL